jgi:hypothetical protein
MDEFQENVDKLAILSDEIMALMPEDPGTEFEAKVGELLARLVQHLEYMDETGDDDAEEEEEAEVEVVLSEEEAAVEAA